MLSRATAVTLSARPKELITMSNLKAIQSARTKTAVFENPEKISREDLMKRGEFQILDYKIFTDTQGDYDEKPQDKVVATVLLCDTDEKRTVWFQAPCDRKTDNYVVDDFLKSEELGVPLDGFYLLGREAGKYGKYYLTDSE